MSRDGQVDPNGQEVLNDRCERTATEGGIQRKASNNQGSIIAASVAVEHAAKTDKPTDSARPASFQRHQTNGRATAASAIANQDACQKLSPDHSAHRNSQRQAAHDYGFSLCPYCVGQVDDTWDEECEHHVELQLGFERADQVCGQQSPSESQEEPR